MSLPLNIALYALPLSCPTMTPKTLMFPLSLSLKRLARPFPSNVQSLPYIESVLFLFHELNLHFRIILVGLEYIKVHTAAPAITLNHHPLLFQSPLTEWIPKIIRMNYTADMWIVIKYFSTLPIDYSQHM